jgi:serine protease AprX
MPRVNVLVEVRKRQEDAFSFHASLAASAPSAVRAGEQLLQSVVSLGPGLEVTDDFPPVPMFSTQVMLAEPTAFARFSAPEQNPDVRAESLVVPCEVDQAQLAKLSGRDDIVVWPNSALTLFRCKHCGDALTEEARAAHPFDLARSGGGVDCRPFQPAVEIEVLRELLGVEAVWRDGFRGQNIVVGIIDEGVNGDVYPVVGGFANPNVQQPGTAPITSHGSMCAADILVAAPAAKLYDYPFLGVPNSGGALRMFQAVLDQRRHDGTPHLTNNSYGFVGRPPQAAFPNHEVWDINHPVHRKVREVITSGAAAFFAAGNCGEDCPSGVCHPSGIGPGQSIHASNSLAEVITVAAVNSRHQRIGYSSQGPGGFFAQKPDVASYSHFFGNFGPGRPAGVEDQPFDNGTSAATPVAAGVGALLLSAVPGVTPDRLKDSLIQTAINIGVPGWDADTGFGVTAAAAAYRFLKTGAAPTPQPARKVVPPRRKKPTVIGRRPTSTKR